MLTIVCSYCNAILGQKDGPDGFTHTVCAACMALSQAERDKLAQMRHAERMRT